MLSTKHIFLNLTTRCNLKCAKCWRSKVWGKGVDIQPLVLKKFMSVFDKYEGRVIVGSGENLICGQLDTYIDWVVMHNIQTTILTTALKFERLIDRPEYFSPNIEWGVTMDGFDDTQIALIQKGMRIDRVKDNLRRIKERYPEAQLYLNYTHTTANLKDTVKLVEFAAELKIKSVYITQLKLFEGLDDSLTKLMVNDTESKELKDALEAAKKVAERHGIKLNAPLKQKKRQCFDSNNINHSPIIDVNGDIYFCYGRNDFIIGNLLADNGEDIWKSYLEQFVADSEIQFRWCEDCHAAKTNAQGYFFIPKTKSAGINA